MPFLVVISFGVPLIIIFSTNIQHIPNRRCHDLQGPIANKWSNTPETPKYCPPVRNISTLSK
jgi:hypothetical protein